jgi:WD40 repeat protein
MPFFTNTGRSIGIGAALVLCRPAVTGSLAQAQDAVYPDILWTAGGHTETFAGPFPFPGGTRVATATANSYSFDDSCIKIWRISDGRLLRTILVPAAWADRIVVSSDDTLIAAVCSDRHVRVWTTADGRLAWMPSAESLAESASFSGDGRYLAVSSLPRLGDPPGGAVEVWDIADRSLVRRIGGLGGATAVALSGDGTTVATVEIHDLSSVLSVWNVASGERLGWLPGEGWTREYDLPFAPDGRSIVRGAPLSRVPIPECEPATQFGERARWAQSIVFTRDGGTIVTGAETPDGGPYVQVWDSTTAALLYALPVIPRFGGTRIALETGSIDHILVGGGGAIHVWDRAAGRYTRRFASGSVEPGAVAATPDGARIVVRGKEGPLAVLDAATGQELLAFAGEHWRPHALYVSADGQRVSGVFSTEAGYVARTWDLESGQMSGRLELGSVQSNVLFLPDALRILITTPDGQLQVWDVLSGTMVASFQTGFVVPLAVSPDGRFLAGSGYDANGHRNPLKLWDLLDGRVVRTFGPDPADWTAAFSPDGRLLVTASWFDPGLRFWDVSSGSLVREVHTGVAVDPTVAFSNDGRMLVVGLGRYIPTPEEPSEIQIIRVADGALMQRYTGETGWGKLGVIAMGDGQRIACPRGDGVMLMIRDPFPPCRCDFNDDGVPDVSDVLAFLQAFSAGDPRADVNGDGLIDVQDFLAFIDRYAAGC